MSSISIKNEQGLALMGSLLLISMLAVMSTAFLLIMAADVRMAQSHLSSTQAYYMAESAVEIAALAISNDPSLVLNAVETDTILQGSIGEGEFYVFSKQLNPAVAYKRELRIMAKSGRAWYDLYIDVLVPSQDPRTYFPIVSWNRLRLQRNCQVIGGEGVWSSNSVTLETPYVQDTFIFDSPSSGDGELLMSGSVIWAPGEVEPGQADRLDVYTNYPAMYTDNPPPAVDPYYPRLLQEEISPYRYKITDDNINYYAKIIETRNVSGKFPGAGKNNPMKIYVWDYDGADGIWEGNKNIKGTLVCPGTAKIFFQDGNVTITPDTLITGTSPDEFYPAIIASGSIEVIGTGTKIFNGLVYSEKEFVSYPDGGGTLLVSGAVIARDIVLSGNTTIQYDTRLYTNPAAAFSFNNTYPMINLHRRRFINTPPPP